MSEFESPTNSDQADADGVTLEFRIEVPRVNRVAWSPDGKLLALGLSDGWVRVYEPAGTKPVASWRAHGSNYVRDIAWHPDGATLATCGDDGAVAVWEWPSGKLINGVDLKSNWVLRLAWSPDHQFLAVATNGGAVKIFDRELRRRGWREGPGLRTAALAWSPDSARLALTRKDGPPERRGELAFYDPESGSVTGTTMDLEGAISLAWSPDDELIVVGSYATGLSVVSPWSSAPRTFLEGPDEKAHNVQFSPDGRFLAAKGETSVTLWRRDPWQLLVTRAAGAGSEARSGLAFRPDGDYLAFTTGNSVEVWRLDKTHLRETAGEDSAFYVTAKIALLGEPGVGKSSLAGRVVAGEFQQHPSTHAQRFWVVPELAGARPDGAVCEAILWDFAGQADYRLVHALLLDDVDIALLLFDPGNTTEPLKGVKYWLRQLDRQGASASAVLVGARMDVAEIAASTDDIEAFCRQNGIAGGYVGTSAYTGDGVADLMQVIRDSVRWESISPTITTATFKRIKDFILQLKSDAGSGNVVQSADELMLSLQQFTPERGFRSAEMAVAVEQLAKHGLVTPLLGAHGARFVLLAPDLLTSLASSVVLEVRRDPMELGTIDEQRLLNGEFAFPELAGLGPGERAVLTDAVVTLFVRHALCFREFIAGRSVLVFPALINQGVMTGELAGTEEDATYVITGPTENIYAALVVLLGYTNTFTRRSQSRDRAEYLMGEEEVCGFRLVREADGELEIALYYGLRTPPPSRRLFEAQVERIIARRQASFVKFTAVRCPDPECGYVQDRGEVRRRVTQNRTFVCCSECGERITLAGVAVSSRPAPAHASVVDTGEQEAYRRTRYEEALVRLKALLRDRGQVTAPSCFISYAWGDPTVERQVRRLRDDLAKSGLKIWFDRTSNAMVGSSIGRFVGSIDECDYVIVVGTPGYLRKYKNRTETGSVVAAEMDVIFDRLLSGEDAKETVLPALMEGDQKTSFPPQLRARAYASVHDDEGYFAGVFDLILAAYQVPFDDPGLEEIRSLISHSARLDPSAKPM